MSLNAMFVCRLRDTVQNLEGGSYSLEQAQAILSEVRNIESLLRAGQKEKQQLHQSLKLLGEDLLLEGQGEGKRGENCPQRHSIASQTEFGAADVSESYWWC